MVSYHNTKVHNLLVMCKFSDNYFHIKQNFLSFTPCRIWTIFAPMVTEQYLRQDLVSEMLRRDLRIIHKKQAEVVNRHLQVRTGTLRAAVSHPEFMLDTSEGRTSVHMRLLSYMRFLDMQYRTANSRMAKKKHANIALYNRVVWGVLYHDTFPDIQAGFTDEVRKVWRQKMEDAINNRILPNEI